LVEWELSYRLIIGSTPRSITYIEFEEGPVELLIVEADDVGVATSVDCDFILASHCACWEFHMGYSQFREQGLRLRADENLLSAFANIFFYYNFS